MATDRRFCRLTRSREANEFGVLWEEENGMCLSTFLILSPTDRPTSVLLGRMNPAAPWDHLAGMDAGRVERFRKGWVLPACQLLLREGPDEAADRLAREWLGGISPALDSPRIVSEVYAPSGHPDAKRHWDLHFLYRGRIVGPVPAVPGVWSELRFVDISRTARSEFARSHDQILDLVGLSPG
jgi:hypothetical protein